MYDIPDQPDGAPGWEWQDDIERQRHEERHMAIMAKGSGDGDFERVPPGTHAARCGLLADIGTQPGGTYGPKRTLVARFEVNDEDTGKPLSVSRFWTLSLNEKAALRRDLETWRGRPFTDAELAGFDVEAVLGAPCMLTVIHDENGRERIQAIAKMPRGMQAPELSHAPIRFSVDDDAPDLGALPEWLSKRAEQSPEMQGRGVSQPVPAPLTAGDTENPGWDDEDVPF